MRLCVEIDDELMAEAMDALGLRTKSATVRAALEMVIRIESQRSVRELFGKVRWVGDLDEMRRD